MPSSRYPTRRMLSFAIILTGSLFCNSGCSLFQSVSSDGLVQNWLVLKPILLAGDGGKAPDEAAQKQAFAKDWLAAAGGEASVQPRAGATLTIDGRPLKWQPVGSKNGVVDLQVPGHETDYAVAYAYVEFDRQEQGGAFLGIGSDDGVKAWLNGQLIHENWANRGVRLDDDFMPVQLQRGKNRLLLKVQNGIGPWGLGCRVISEDEGQAIQAVNRQLQAIVEGDVAGIRASCRTTTDDDARRVDAAAAMYASVASMRRAFDEAYGRGQLARLGFRCLSPGLRLPPRAQFRIAGKEATFNSPGWSTITLTRVDGAWKEQVIPWTEVVKLNKAKGEHVLSSESVVANLKAMSRIIDEIAADVRAGKYLSAADAYGVLNARLHGLADSMAPIELAATVDLTAPATQPAACPVPIVELRGDAATIGKSYGSQLHDPIRLLHREYLNKVLASHDVWFAPGATRQVLLGLGDTFKPMIRPEHLEEIRALAASAGVDPRETLLGQCFTDLAGGPGCSTITLPASASSDQVARFGRNMDFMSFGLLDRHSVLLVVHPKDRYAFAAVTWPGLVGVLSGMNEHGLTLACMEVPRPHRKPEAMPFMLLYRSVLEHCKTVEEAIAFLEKTPRQTSHTLMLMDASGDRAVAEITPEKVTVRRAPDTAALVSTNHHRGTDLDTAGRCKRFDSLHDAARRQFGQFSEAGVEELLRGVAQGDFTLQSMVFEPTNRVVYLAVGAGAPNHGFWRIDLKPYFR